MTSRGHEVCFLALSTAGFFLLWGVMAYNGTLSALIRAASSGAVADGRSLRTTYTRFPPIDFAIAVLVAFFDPQIDGRDDGTWLFLFDFYTFFQTATLWALVEAKRKGQGSPRLKLYFLWPLLTNLVGAAVIIPLYFYFHTQDSNFRKADPSISTRRARSLIPIVILTSFAPALSMLFGYRYLSDSSRQAVIAGVQFSPLILAAAVYLTPETSLGRSREELRDNYVNLVRQSYVLAGSLGGITHLCTLIITLSSKNPTLRFSRIFNPLQTRFSSGSIETIHLGGLLFLQYDWIIVNISCALWVHSLLHTGQIFSSGRERRIAIPAILFATFFLGPGGTVCIALWIREEELRRKYANSHHR